MYRTNQLQTYVETLKNALELRIPEDKKKDISE